MQPKKLQSGDSVAIIAPAKKIDAPYIERAKAFFEEKGLNVLIGEHALKQHFQFAGTDEERASDLQWAVNHPNVKAIICARGGYGTVRVVDRIDFSPLKNYPKFIVGFSDITVLHNHIHTHLGIETIHGTVPLNFPEAGTNDNLESLITALQTGKTAYQIPHHSFNRHGNAEAQLVGGNLAMLESLAGTNSDIDTTGKILLLEEISEYAYRVDRMLYNLKKGGKLESLAGLILGGFTDIKEGKDHFGKDGYEMVQDIISEYNFPVCYGFPAGHQPENRAIFFGRKTTLNVKPDSVIFKQN